MVVGELDVVGVVEAGVVDQAVDGIQGDAGAALTKYFISYSGKIGTGFTLSALSYLIGLKKNTPLFI